MAAGSIGSGTISFGLVAIPVPLYVATRSDAYRGRVQALVDKKIAAEEIAVAEAGEAQPQVIDLMQALKESLA